MPSLFDLYRSPEAPLSPQNLCWNMYGRGIENIGRGGKPERCPLPQPNADQLLVRVDVVGLCLSDIKLIEQGGKHPKLYDRDLATEPTRLGHEVALTVMRVGERMRGQFHPGQQLALQPDIYQGGLNAAYGYSIPGGLIRFHLVGAEILHADGGSYILPVEGDLGYAETALTEPWACVAAAYTQRRRLAPKPQGTMWMVGRSGDRTEYRFSSGMEAPTTIVATDVPAGLLAMVEEALMARGGSLKVRNGLSPAEYPQLYREFGGGFDDVILLDPRSALDVSAAAAMIAPRGTFNLVGRRRLDGNPLIDVGRIHYEFTAFLGTTGPDIAAAYGEGRNRCDLRPGGTAIFVGAGGPMGQMHVQRAIEMPNGPATILTTDLNAGRLEVLRARFGPLAQRKDKRLVVSDSGQETLLDFVLRETHGRGADDSVVCVPSADVIAEAAQSLTQDGMLVVFAGVPRGTLAPLNLSDVYLQNAQFTGTSGSAIADQSSVIRAALAGELSPGQSVAAIGGMEAAHDGIHALMEGQYPGKTLIFPQLSGLPLTGLPDLTKVSPQVAGRLDSSGGWTREAESALIDQFWKP